MLARKTIGRLNCKIKKRQVSVLHALRRPYICPHDTRTTRILRTGNTAASLSFDRCGADAVRQAREPRRLNPPDGPRPPQTWMPHASCARRPAPSDERQSDQGKKSGRSNRLLHWKRASARVPRKGAQRRRPGTQEPHASCRPAHTDELRYPGRTADLAARSSFKPAPASQPFLDSGVRRNERFMFRDIRLT